MANRNCELYTRTDSDKIVRPDIHAPDPDSSSACTKSGCPEISYSDILVFVRIDSDMYESGRRRSLHHINLTKTDNSLKQVINVMAGKRVPQETPHSRNVMLYAGLGDHRLV